MLRRIKKLKNIGRFANCHCPTAQFAGITVIHGLNTYGKSTLSDILSSLSNDDLAALKSRKSIPSTSGAQVAELSFEGQAPGAEKVFTISGNSWSPSPAALSLRIFDDSFYHRNVFQSAGFTRETKVNLSSFILGEQGVEKAEKISKTNKENRASTKRKNELLKDSFSEIENLTEFIALEVEETQTELEEEIETLLAKHKDLKRRRENSDKIFKRKNLTPLLIQMNIESSIEEVNELLSTSLGSHHDEARERVSKHIERKFGDSAEGEKWVREGTTMTEGDSCQFCGQDFGEEAQKLIAAYRESFDSSFEKHEEKVRHGIDEAIGKIKNSDPSPLRLALSENREAISSYPELAEEQDRDGSDEAVHFSDEREAIQDLETRIESHIETLDNFIREILPILEEARSKKMAQPHREVEEVEIPSEIVSESEIQACITSYNKAVDNLNSIFNAFKDSVKPEQINTALASIKENGTLARRKLNRVKLNTQAKDYRDLSQKIESTKNLAEQLNQELRDEQSDYLRDFFDNLNFWFKKFGSREFELLRGEDRSGHTPVYYLKVKFRGQEISEKSLRSVFSESDRRALSLAIFWTELRSISTALLSDTIVVLDDPITSFDNNRISSVHREIIEISRIADQVIVLSHYESEIAKFLSTYSQSYSIVLLSITLKNGESHIEKGDEETFVLSEHEKASRRLIEFANGQTNSYNTSDLRIFLELELNLRFQKQLQESGDLAATLKDKIESLHSNGHISNSVSTKLHDWRTDLNPSHHTWTSAELEDQRNAAQGFLDFVYTELRTR